MNIDWVSDLDQLNSELPELHKKTFSAKEKASFRAQINALKQRLTELDTYSIATQIARIVATIGDAHTTVMLPRHARLPLECYWFAQGIYITFAVCEFAHLSNSKIVAVQGVRIEEVIDRFAQIISHENQNFIKSQLPGYLVCADLLYGIGILDDSTAVNLTLANENSEQNVDVPTVLYEGFDLSTLIDSTDPLRLPLHRQNRDKNYWSELIGSLLYFNYNRCKDMDEISVADFTLKLRLGIEKNPSITKLVIDLRNNGGGNSQLLHGFLEWLRSYPPLNQKGRLFVIVGRDTFSSALLNTFFLAQRTQAIFVGEPTGGKPNSYGEVKYLSLNSSGLLIRYSTNYYELIDDDAQNAFIPDVIFDISANDYAHGIDPCMDYITKQ